MVVGGSAMVESIGQLFDFLPFTSYLYGTVRGPDRYAVPIRMEGDRVHKSVASTEEEHILSYLDIFKK